MNKTPYFFGYQQGFIALPKQSHGSRFLGLFRKVKTCIKAKFYRTDLVICSHSVERKTSSYSRGNTKNYGTVMIDYFSLFNYYLV